MQASQRSCFTGAPLGRARSVLPRRASVPPPSRVSALFGFGKKDDGKEEEKEEQFRKQQEVLARRRNNSWQAEVKERRQEVSKYMRDPVYKKKIDDEKRARFKARKEQEERDNPVPKFGIIVPITPFGMPDYDQTERFDLRLPFVDQGDPDEELANDPLGLKQLGRAFGLGKKQQQQRGQQGGSGGKKGGK